LTAGKLTIAIVACCCACLTLAPVAPADSGHGRSAKSRVTIYPWPNGLFGYVKSHKSPRCSDHRRVAVFQQRGKGKHPARDRRIATVRAKRHRGFYQWSARTSRSGRFYAKVRRTARCRPNLSRSVRYPRAGAGAGAGNGAGGYPDCSPSLGETSASVCRVKAWGILNGGDQACGFFGAPHDVCQGEATEGTFPWAINTWGNRPRIQFAWSWADHYVKFWSYTPDGKVASALVGRVPNSSSAEYSISSGEATIDPDTSPTVHFYTPDIPGQKPGEPGGPLYLNFINKSGLDPDRVEITGYMYVAR
jgi:hypothetical protein